MFKSYHYLLLIILSCVIKPGYAKQGFNYNTLSSIYVFGDIDGRLHNIESTLRKLNLIDENNNWSGEEQHVVSLGNFVAENDNDDNEKIIDLFRSLESQAKYSGGRFHVLLGNNELSHLLSNDDNKHANHAITNKSLFKLSKVHRDWLGQLPFVIKINQELFTHGGLAKSLTDKDVNELNNRLLKALADNLTQNTIQGERSNAAKTVLFTIDNPVNYQGNLICHPFYATENLRLVLKRFGAGRLWSGLSTSRGKGAFHRLDEKLIILNSGVSNKTPSLAANIVVAKIDSKADLTFYDVISQQNLALLQLPHRTKSNVNNLSDSEIEEFMLTAKITKKAETEYGITKPYKVIMEKEGKTLKGIFKYLDSRPGNNRRKWSRDGNYTDRYQYEVAAYQLDKLLNIGLVPIAVERSLDNQDGVVILWIDDLISELKMDEQNIQAEMTCDLKDQTNMMNVFDYLIRNIDRNQSNTLFNKNDWQLWFIDHSRSFNSTTRRQALLKKTKINVSKEFRLALQRLTYEQLAELQPWLHREQIKGLWARRNKLIDDKF